MSRAEKLLEEIKKYKEENNQKKHDLFLNGCILILENAIRQKFCVMMDDICNTIERGFYQYKELLKNILGSHE